jgi:3-oxoadipate enol-lactonase
MPFATGARSTRIYYEVTGERGPWVVLIHGLGLSGRFWFDLPQRLAADPQHPYRVITFDNRGTGRSACPKPPYRMGDMADDAIAALDAAGAEAADVVGISLGGMIAQHVALRHPTRVRGLALLATTPGLPQGRLPQPRHLTALLAAGLARRDQPTPAMARLLLSAKHLPQAKELLAEWPAAMAAEPLSSWGFLGQLAAAATHSTASRLAAIACPTVIVAGDEDILQPPDNSRLLARLIPHAELEVLRQVGHAIPLGDPEVVARCLAKLQLRR